MKREIQEEDNGGAAKDGVAKKAKAEESDDEAPLKAKPQAVLSSCVLVTGTEFKDTDMRDNLKKLGASWCKGMGWVLPESSRAAVQKLIDGGEPDAADVAAVADSAAAKDPPTSDKGKKKFGVSGRESYRILE